MTIKELIEKLQEYDDAFEVFVDGAEIAGIRVEIEGVVIDSVS